MVDYTWPSKAGDEVLDYEIEWGPELVEGDSIISYSWTVDRDSLVIGNQTRRGSRLRVWLSRGIPGRTYQLKNTILTAHGRSLEANISLLVTDPPDPEVDPDNPGLPPAVIIRINGKEGPVVTLTAQDIPGIPEETVVAGTIYVQRNGNNANHGRSIGQAVRHIERALELAQLAGEPMLIEVSPEMDIRTQGHLDIPDGCVVRCAHRTVSIRPAAGFEQRNVFRLGDGCFVEGFLFEGFRVDNLVDPSEGFAFSFRPGAVINRVPYAHKCAVRSLRNWSLVAPPLDRANGNPLVGFGPGVVLADGMVCSQYSSFPNFMTWGATPVLHNGIGYCAKNGGMINAVNAVALWAHRHYLALNGGLLVLSGCANQFGDWSLEARGSRAVVVPGRAAITLTVQSAAASAIEAATPSIVDDMWSAMVANGLTLGWTQEDETFTRADGAMFLRCLGWTLLSANEQPMLDFARGLFNVLGQRVFSNDKLGAFTYSFERMRDYIAGLGISAQAQAIVAALVAALNATLTNPQTRREPSRITATGHSWTAVLAGVALSKIPPAFNRAEIGDSIIERDGGVVVASGTDDAGNQIFVGGANISGDNGEFGGEPFIAGVRRIATRASIVRSF